VECPVGPLSFGGDLFAVRLVSLPNEALSQQQRQFVLYLVQIACYLLPVVHLLANDNCQIGYGRDLESEGEEGEMRAGCSASSAFVWRAINT